MEDKEEYKLAKYEQGEAESRTVLALRSVETVTAMANQRTFPPDARKLLFCLESGLPLSTAFTPGVYVVNGNVGGVEGKVIAAQIKRHPRYDYDILELTDKVCRVRLWEKSKRTGEWASLDYEYTYAEAQKSGVTEKGLGTWKTHTKDHLFGACFRRIGTYYAGDLFSSPIYTPDEFEAVFQSAKPIPKITVTKPEEIPFQELMERYGPAIAGRIIAEAQKSKRSWQEVAAELSPDFDQLWARLIAQYGEEKLNEVMGENKPKNLDELAVIAANLESEVKE